MTKLTYEIITKNRTYNADTYAEALRIKEQNLGSTLKRVYTPIPEKTTTFPKIKRVLASVN